MKKSIKTVGILLAIILICGGLLAILSDLLFVSDDERIARAINGIYSTEEVELDETIEVDDYDTSSFEERGVIKSCYKLSNGDYLVLATGKKGYSNGTVTVYVAIDCDGVAKKVVQDSYTGQTLMSKLSSLYDEFKGKTIEDGFDGVKETVSGATYSSTATSNAVYVALEFVAMVQGGEL